MKNIFLITIFAGVTSSCVAGSPPALGVLEQIAVLGNGSNVVARPTYIFSSKKLTASTVFSGLQESGGSISVVCCFEVDNLIPLDLKSELAKYGRAPGFSDQLRGIKGYSYIYSAKPISDKRKWSPLMKTVMSIAADATDGSPFSAPVIAAEFGKHEVPTRFTVSGTKISLRTWYDSDDMARYTFKVGDKVFEFSEPTQPH